MKIENSFALPTTPISSRPAAKPASTSSQDSVSLSSLAGSLQNSEDMPVDRARIEEIKQAIAQGRFEINSGAIADKLVETARSLINSQNKNAS